MFITRLETLLPIGLLYRLFFLFEADIQERTTNFQYGYFDKNDRPPPVLSKHLQSDRIVGTAAQKLCFFRLFPIIFHDLIHLLPSMIVYKQLREILDVVLSIPFRKEWLPSLRDHCAAFQQSMIRHFPEKMVPKIHFICEYASIVQDYGPLKRQWCFRYEAAHAYFKKVAVRSNNSKNVPKMLATRFVFKQCMRSLRSWSSNDACSAVGIRKLSDRSLNEKIKCVFLQHFGTIDFIDGLVECRKLICQNMEYVLSAIYIVGIAVIDDQPLFAQLCFIVKRNGKWWLVVERLETIKFDDNLFAWQLNASGCFSILDPCELRIFYKGLDCYQANNSTYVSFTSRLTSHD